MHLTPSSYSLVLTGSFGVAPADTGLLWGRPRGIRYDEHSVFTPSVQTCERNGYRRRNVTSPYDEDLIGALSLPIRDAGLLFKPYFLVSVFGDAALGYAFYWAFWSFLFVAGYFLLFRRLDVGPGVAILGSLALFGTSYVQMWWTSFAPTLSVVPWVFLAVQSPLPRITRFLVATYVVAVWIIAFPYPGFIVIHSVLVIALLASQSTRLRDRLEAVGILAAASVAASIVSLWYLRDWVFGMIRTELAQRSVSGGSVSLCTMASYLYPPFALKRFESLVPPNGCEVSTVGSLIFIGAILCCPTRLMQAARRSRLLVMFAACLVCWMILPIPSIVGRIVLIDKTFPGRLSFACGLPLFVIVLRAFDRIDSVPPTSRAMALAGFFVMAIAAKCWLFGYPLPGLDTEIAIAIVSCAMAVAVFYALQRSGRLAARPGPVLLAAFVGPSLLYFMGFNPLQSSRQIFATPRTAVTRRLDELQADDPRGWLLVNGFQGGVLNGLGYRSITHTLYNPQPEFFAPFVRDMRPAAYDRIFDRWGYVVVETGTVRTQPRVIGGLVIVVPAHFFDPVDEHSP